MRVPDLTDIAAGPDLAHAAVAQATLDALAQLVDHVGQLQDSFLLGQTAFDFAQTVLTNFTALQQVVTEQAAQIADLQSRVSALENPPATTG